MNSHRAPYKVQHAAGLVCSQHGSPQAGDAFRMPAVIVVQAWVTQVDTSPTSA
jgi:hypothetical protein